MIVPLTLLGALLALVLAWYGVVAVALYQDERERFDTHWRAAARFAATWPQRAYIEWRTQ